MQLKDVLGEIEADGADLVHGRLLEWALTPPLWHVGAHRGRPHHQALLEWALTRISHTFCDTEAIRSEKVSRCKSLTAVGQADPFRQSVVQPSGGRLMDIG